MKTLTATMAVLVALASPALALAGSITEKVTGCETYVNDAGQRNLVIPGCLGRSAGGANPAAPGGGFFNAYAVFKARQAAETPNVEAD